MPFFYHLRRLASQLAIALANGEEVCKAIVQQDGALGVPTSLIYVPDRFADTEELIALSRVAARLGGIYATHQRSEGDGIESSLAEIFRIGREASIPVHIFHLKLSGRDNWRKAGLIIGRIESERAAGLQVILAMH